MKKVVGLLLLVLVFPLCASAEQCGGVGCSQLCTEDGTCSEVDCHSEVNGDCFCEKRVKWLGDSRLVFCDSWHPCSLGCDVEDPFATKSAPGRHEQVIRQTPAMKKAFGKGYSEVLEVLLALRSKEGTYAPISDHKVMVTRSLPGQTLANGEAAYEKARVVQVTVTLEDGHTLVDMRFLDEGLHAQGDIWAGGRRGVFKIDPPDVTKTRVISW